MDTLKFVCRLLLIVSVAMIARDLFSRAGSPGPDLRALTEEARSEHKMILLDFTGSDWCVWCMRMEREIIDTPEFAAYAQDNLILTTVDFPRRTPLSAELKQRNERLAAQYGVKGYPTFVLVDGSGRELGRQMGYRPGGVAAFIAQLDTFYTPRAHQGLAGR